MLKEIHIYGNQGRIDRHAEKYWSKNKPSVFQVQEFVPANTPVHHKGRDWNATTRLVWSVLIGSDAQTGEETMLIKLHGGTYKLPRRDAHDHGFLRGMFGGHAGNAPVKQANVISYSQSHGVFESVFSLVAKRFGRGEHIAIKDPAALAHEGAKLAQDIETTFVYLESHSYADLLHQIGASSAVGREIVRDLKKSYPVNPAAEAVQAIYPQAPQPAG